MDRRANRDPGTADCGDRAGMFRSGGHRPARGRWRRPASSRADLDHDSCGHLHRGSPLPSTACLVQHDWAREGRGLRCLRSLLRIRVCPVDGRCLYQNRHRGMCWSSGAEVMSAITDWTDRKTCILFGDGAGAAVVSPVGRGSRRYCRRICVPTEIYGDLICGARRRVPHAAIRESRCRRTQQFHQDEGKRNLKVAVKTLEEIARETLAAMGSQSRISTSMCRIRPTCVFLMPWRSGWVSRWKKLCYESRPLWEHVGGLDSIGVG